MIGECWHVCPGCRKDWSHRTQRAPQDCAYRKLCGPCRGETPAKEREHGLGVSPVFHQGRVRWRAYFYRPGPRRVHIGYFATEDEALAARRQRLERETNDARTNYTTAPAEGDRPLLQPTGLHE